MQNQPLFETSFVSEVNPNYYSKDIGLVRNKCTCERCQSEALLPLYSTTQSRPRHEVQQLFETLPQSNGETLLEWETMESESGGEGWFWQAISQALSATRSAIVYLNLKQPNVPRARQALEIARHRTTLAGALAGKTVRQLARHEDVKKSIAYGHVALQRSQNHLSENNVNIAIALTEAKKAIGAIGGAMRLATAKSGVKVWN